MLLRELELNIPRGTGENLIDHFRTTVRENLSADEVPIRFVVTGTNETDHHCELGVLAADQGDKHSPASSIFDFAPRACENTDQFNAVFLVPTGIGAELGGHAGDAAPTARLLAAACDTLITHPNVVNASDINEIPENGLYVEGSVISRLMMGTIGLQKVRSNRVLLVIDEHSEPKIADLSINAASAARAAMGLDCSGVVKMTPPVHMKAWYSSSGSAVGRIENMEFLCDVLERHKGEYDAVALASIIDVPKEFHMEYFEADGEMVNPWGGVEAMLTHAISIIFDVPSAHAPMVESLKIAELAPGAVDPRMAPEAVSSVFLHCVLKGLHRSPRITTDTSTFGHPGILSAADLSCLVIPDGCVGLPTLAALEQGIPVIAVRENKNLMRNDLAALPFAANKLFIVENYLEAVGVMTALKAGVAVETVRRPLGQTKITTEHLIETPAASEMEQQPS